MQSRMEFTKEPTASSWESFLDFDFPFALPSTSDGSSDDNTTLLLPEAVASSQAKDNCDIRSDSSEAGLSLLDFKGENSILNVEGCTRDVLELNEDACSSSQSAVGLGCTEAAAPPAAAPLTVGESSQNESGANERIIQTICVPKPPAVKRQRVAKPRKPKKPRTGYNYFHLMSRSIFMDDLKGQGIMGDKERLNAEVNRRIAQQWRTLTPSDKTMYTEKAEADKVRYEEEMRAYRNATGPPSHEHAPGNQNHSQSRCLPGTLDELRALATKLGIKKQGKGWQLCCPPNGVKSDICRAIMNHLNLPQYGSLATARALDHLLRKNSSTATAATTDRIVASETTSSAEGVGGMDIDFAVPPAAISISSSPPPPPPPSLSQGKVSSSTPTATTTTTTANNIKNNAVADTPGKLTAFATMQRPISGNNNEHKKRPSHKSQQCAAGTTGPLLPLPTPHKRGGKQQPMPLMSMRNNLATPSRSWLLELAQKHNLLSDDTKPFLKDAMAAIENEVSLTMTRMSRQVLKLVSRQQHPAAGNDNHLSFNNKKRKNQATDGASASGSSSSAAAAAAAAAFHTFNLVDCEPNEQKFIANPELVRMINTVSPNDISRPQSLVKLSSGEVKGFFLLNKPLCDLLIREAKRCAKACRLKLGQISLKRLGLHGAVSRLALQCIIPTVGLSAEERYDIEGSVIYDGDRPLFEDYRYSCDPADGWSFSGSERSLPTHKDDSMITINMCLGERFTGGSVLFEDIVEIEHQVCRGIVHPGNMRHKITPCRGQRFNLILFLNKKSSC